MVGDGTVRVRAAILFALLAATASIFGFVTATPRAVADGLPNGYSIACTPNGGNVVCNISGCPRVKADLAGDVVHVKINGGPQAELDKACGNTTTTTISNAATTVSIQGCRKHTTSSDDCGAWSDYKYNPPPQAGTGNEPKPVKCTGGPDAGKTLPPGSTCAAAVAAPTRCPTGSVADTVPAGQKCSPPTNAVSMSVSRNGFNARVAINNNSGLPAKCNYTATKSQGIGPGEVDRSVDVGANGTGTITDMLFPPLGTTYNATVKCTAQYDGRTVTIGQTSQAISG
jgi:hypothetical protein